MHTLLRIFRLYWPPARTLVVFGCLSVFAGAARGQEVSEYGSSKATDSALIGILYDCKQDQQRQRKPMNQRLYDELLNEFLSSGWDETVLNRYYRVSDPLYTSQIYIPLSRASGAPKAFDVEDVVEPSYWLIHYKGQVTPPGSGRWRFWGYGSEVCSVAVNGKLVLASNWVEDSKLHPIPLPGLKWESSAPPGRSVHRGLLTASTWLTLQAGEVLDLDVLIGERAGGNFCAVLLIEKEGESYETRDGHPLYHVFQLAPYQTPAAKDSRKAPPFAQNGPIWRGVQ